MKRASRPKPSRVVLAHILLSPIVLAGTVLAPAAAWAQSPVASAYATRDGRAASTVLGCASTDTSFTAQPCGVSGYPLHVTVDGAVPAASSPLPPGAALAALQPALNGDGGALAHVSNFPASQPVTNAGSFAVQDSAVITAIATVIANTAHSGAWTDASFTATGAASVPAALVAVASRVGIDIENLNTPGGATACLNWTSAATVSGAGCGVGSIPVYAGGARTWDQPGNVSPEAISLICAGTACPLTIKVR